MSTLLKFKLLATQCATAASSPTRSPAPDAARKSPSFHLCRRKILGNFLSRSSSRRSVRREEISGENPAMDLGEGKGLLSHTSLKDLFVSSPPIGEEGDVRHGGVPVSDGVGCRDSRFGVEGFRAGFGSRRGFSEARFGSPGGLRYRLHRRPWRPVLFSIPE